MYRFAMLILALLSMCHQTIAQEIRQLAFGRVQTGLGLKLSIDVHPFKRRTYSHAYNYRISTTFGVGVVPKEKGWANFQPSLVGSVELYHGGFGIGKVEPKRKWTGFGGDFRIQGAITIGVEPDLITDPTNNLLWNNPLIVNGPELVSPLVNPYRHSLTIGSGYTFFSHLCDYQREGFIGISSQIGEKDNNKYTIQAMYHNDGAPPMSCLWLGDKYDRYYSGGMMISFLTPLNNVYNRFAVSYNKFSGHVPDAFEAMYELDAFVTDYDERGNLGKQQKLLNKSQWMFEITRNIYTWENWSAEQNLPGLVYKAYNSKKFDGQHMIHWLTQDPYHWVYFPVHHNLGISHSRTLIF